MVDTNLPLRSGMGMLEVLLRHFEREDFSIRFATRPYSSILCRRLCNERGKCASRYCITMNMMTSTDAEMWPCSSVWHTLRLREL